MRKIFRMRNLLTLCMFMAISLCFITKYSVSKDSEYVTVRPIVKAKIGSNAIQISYQPPKKMIPTVKIEDYMEDEEVLSNTDIELIALVTMAEAEGECEEGKRLVIDTILNRVDSKYFPDTVYGVIYQPSQFSSMWNGRVNRCTVQEYICQLVKEEAESRLNNEVVFFTAGEYGKYGVPMFQVENHYFSSYE